MSDTRNKRSTDSPTRFTMVGLTLAMTLFGAGVARAQETPPPAPPMAAPPMAAPVAEAPPPAAEPVPPTPAAEPPMAPPPPAMTPPPDAPPTSAEAMPATRPDALPPIDVGAWVRAGGIFQNGSDPSKVDDWHMDTALVELHAGGKIHQKVGVTLNLVSNMVGFGSGDSTASIASQVGSFVAVEDAIISFDFDDAFHVWAGHLLVPVDRSNASGPFFMIPWNYPGFFGGVVAAPMEGPFGRNNGMVVWGDVGGKLTYLAGVFDNANVSTSPLFSGRVRLSLWDPELGFWGNGSFFGDKDILSIGVGGQFMKDGSGPGKDWADINADVLVEKKLGGGSFVTGEGAYYHYNVNDGAVSDTFYLLAAFATGPMGVGALQPSARFQFAKVKGDGAPKPWNLDVSLAYLIKGPALRVVGTFSHTDFDALDVTANSVQIGAQAIFF